MNQATNAEYAKVMCIVDPGFIPLLYFIFTFLLYCTYLHCTSVSVQELKGVNKIQETTPQAAGDDGEGLETERPITCAASQVIICHARRVTV